MNSAVPFTLRIPESWFEFEICRGGACTGDLVRLVDARVAAHPELQPYRSALIKALREAAETAEARGAVYCASMLEKVDDAGMLAANLMVFYTESPSGGRTVEEIANQMTAISGADDTAWWRDVEILDLPAGRAVRVKVVNGLVTMQTLIPVPGDRGVLDVVLTSPEVDLAEPFLDLFEAVSGTLAWPDS